MAQRTLATPRVDPLAIEMPPTQDELPYSDGEPMESERHFKQMQLLIDALDLHWGDRDFYVGGNMFVYYNLGQLRNQDFKGPDVFIVLDVPRGERKSWVSWEESKGPDVVIELLSASTAHIDKGPKMRIYQNMMRVVEYYWYDPFSTELAGFKLTDGVYKPLRLDKEDRLVSPLLGLTLVRWTGKYKDVEATWLRWATLDGTLLPTSEENAEAAQREAEAAQREAVAAQQRATELEALLARYRQQYGDLDATTGDK